MFGGVLSFDGTFLSTPSARRATLRRWPPCGWSRYFYPRPPRGGRHPYRPSERGSNEFLSTPSARRATDTRELWDSWNPKFLSTPSARRATTDDLNEAIGILFLSTPSARRATLQGARHQFLGCISIHALREEGDLVEGQDATGSHISIHALREEGDSRQPARSPSSCNFYPRPPRGGRPPKWLHLAAHAKISIHALREEGDLLSMGIVPGMCLFLSTPSARRATWASP